MLPESDCRKRNDKKEKIEKNIGDTLGEQLNVRFYTLTWGRVDLPVEVEWTAFEASCKQNTQVRGDNKAPGCSDSDFPGLIGAFK